MSEAERAGLGCGRANYPAIRSPARKTRMRLLAGIATPSARCNGAGDAVC